MVSRIAAKPAISIRADRTPFNGIFNHPVSLAYLITESGKSIQIWLKKGSGACISGRERLDAIIAFYDMISE